MQFKSLISNLNIMNAALLSILVLVAVYEFPSFFRIQPKYTPPSPASSVKTEEKTVEAQPLSPSEYSVIAEQNIFHPERIIPVLKAEAPPLPKPEFVLYGTLITGDLSLAYIEDLKGSSKSPAGGKRQKALKKGEDISGFILKEIETDKVVMVRGEEKLEVRVTDKPRSKGNGSAPATQASPVQPASGSVRRLAPSAQGQANQGQANEGKADELRKRRESLRSTRSTRQAHDPQQNVPQ